jgi:hypothetical protein
VEGNIVAILFFAENMSTYVITDCFHPHDKSFPVDNDLKQTIGGKEFKMVPEIAYILGNLAHYIAKGVYIGIFVFSWNVSVITRHNFDSL